MRSDVRCPLAIYRWVLGCPCAQTIHVAIGHTECGGDENRIVNLQVCASVGTGSGDILLGDVLSPELDFPSNIQ